MTGNCKRWDLIFMEVVRFREKGGFGLFLLKWYGTVKHLEHTLLLSGIVGIGLCLGRETGRARDGGYSSVCVG